MFSINSQIRAPKLRLCPFPDLNLGCWAQCNRGSIQPYTFSHPIYFVVSAACCPRSQKRINYKYLFALLGTYKVCACLFGQAEKKSPRRGVGNKQALHLAHLPRNPRPNHLTIKSRFVFLFFFFFNEQPFQI